MSVSVHLSLFGDFVIVVGGKPVASVQTPRLQSLLAYLVLHRSTPQPRQRLAFLLWPDTSDAQAQTNLRQLVHRLRAALPQVDAYLIAEGRTLQWNPAPATPFTLDVAEFECMLTQAMDQPHTEIASWSAAIELYRGDLLSHLYDDWVIEQRERLRLGYIGALEGLSAALASEERYDDALRYAERLKNADPWRESAYRTLIELSLASGDLSSAARYYVECAGVLDRELGVQPSPATQAAYRRILQLTAQLPESEVALAALPPTKKAAPTNLPTQPNSFVGRQAEMAALGSLLGRDGVRLVTLVGAPGIGKTRLALRVGDVLSSNFPDGVYMVALASLSDPSAVAPAIARALGVRERANQPVVETIAEEVADKRLLLLLDNFEHLLDAAMTVSTLLSSCPNLKVLATSREALQLYGEHGFSVPPLELPSAEESARMEVTRLSEYSALKLFEERASAVQHSFTLDAANTPTVALICHRLDALPLAIELAATRVKLMSPATLLARLESSLDALPSGARNLPARHRTLRAAIEWSYSLLTSDEQILLATCSVFAGGCTLQAVSYVSGADVQEGMSSLLDKSLLIVEQRQGGEPRFKMLEMIREFALEKLVESGREIMLRERHMTFYLDWSEGNKSLLDFATGESLQQFETEDLNLTAAIEWAIAHDRLESAASLSVNLWRYWAILGRAHYAIGLLNILMPDVDKLPKLIQARMLPMGAAFAQIMGDFARASSIFQRGVEVSRELGDMELLADALRLWAFGTLLEGDLVTAERASTEALGYYTSLDHALGIAASCLTLAVVSLYKGHEAAGDGYYGRTSAVFPGLKDSQALSFNHALYGHASLSHGRYDVAEMMLKDGLQISRQIKDMRNSADCMLSLGEIAVLREGATVETLERVATIFGAAQALLRRTGAVVWPLHMPAYERSLSIVRLRLGEEKFESAWQRGQTLHPGEAIKLTLGETD